MGGASAVIRPPPSQAARLPAASARAGSAPVEIVLPGAPVTAAELHYHWQDYEVDAAAGVRDAGGVMGAQRRFARMRNLPPSAVAILRDWVMAHLDQPYPSDAEKAELAARAKITKKQVRHWLTNARKRIVRPLAEQMGIRVQRPAWHTDVRDRGGDARGGSGSGAAYDDADEEDEDADEEGGMYE
jgi:hypothetical protein